MDDMEILRRMGVDELDLDKYGEVVANMREHAAFLAGPWASRAKRERFLEKYIDTHVRQREELMRSLGANPPPKSTS